MSDSTIDILTEPWLVSLEGVTEGIFSVAKYLVETLRVCLVRRLYLHGQGNLNFLDIGKVISVTEGFKNIRIIFFPCPSLLI